MVSKQVEKTVTKEPAELKAAQVTHLHKSCEELTFRADIHELAPGRYKLAMVYDENNVQQIFWDHRDPNKKSAPLVDAVTGGELNPDVFRGKPLPRLMKQFHELHPGSRVIQVWSMGDLLVNMGRCAVVQRGGSHVALGVRKYIPTMKEYLEYIIGYMNGQIAADRLRFEFRRFGDGRDGDGIYVPVAAFSEGCEYLGNILEQIKFAIHGLPAMTDGVVDIPSWAEENDDTRQVVANPMHHGNPLLRQEVLRAREVGGPMEPLDFDLANGEGEVPKETLDALKRGAYNFKVGELENPGDMVPTGPTTVKVLPLPANYPISMIGITRNGNLASYVAKADIYPHGGYVSVPVEAQIRMVASLFETLHIVDEGLDPMCYIPGRDGSPEEYLVRGKPGGRLAAVLVIYEDLPH